MAEWPLHSCPYVIVSDVSTADVHMATKKRGCPCTLNEEEGCGLAMVLARKDWIMTKYRSIVSVFVEIGIEALWK